MVANDNYNVNKMIWSDRISQSSKTPLNDAILLENFFDDIDSDTANYFSVINTTRITLNEHCINASDLSVVGFYILSY